MSFGPSMSSVISRMEKLKGRSPESLLARALFDNKADSADELSFRKGEVLTVLQQGINGNNDWWLCMVHGRQGLAPSNRLTLLPTTAVPTPKAPIQDTGVVHNECLPRSPQGDYDIPKMVTSVVDSDNSRGDYSVPMSRPNPDNLRVQGNAPSMRQDPKHHSIRSLSVSPMEDPLYDIPSSSPGHGPVTQGGQAAKRTVVFPDNTRLHNGVHSSPTPIRASPMVPTGVPQVELSDYEVPRQSHTVSSDTGSSSNRAAAGDRHTRDVKSTADSLLVTRRSDEMSRVSPTPTSMSSPPASATLPAPSHVPVAMVARDSSSNYEVPQVRDVDLALSAAKSAVDREGDCDYSDLFGLPQGKDRKQDLQGLMATSKRHQVWAQVNTHMVQPLDIGAAEASDRLTKLHVAVDTVCSALQRHLNVDNTTSEKQLRGLNMASIGSYSEKLKVAVRLLTEYGLQCRGTAMRRKHASFGSVVFMIDHHLEPLLVAYYKLRSAVDTLQTHHSWTFPETKADQDRFVTALRMVAEIAASVPSSLITFVRLIDSYAPQLFVEPGTKATVTTTSSASSVDTPVTAVTELSSADRRKSASVCISSPETSRQSILLPTDYVLDSGKRKYASDPPCSPSQGESLIRSGSFMFGEEDGLTDEGRGLRASGLTLPRGLATANRFNSETHLLGSPASARQPQQTLSLANLNTPSLVLTPSAQFRERLGALEHAATELLKCLQDDERADRLVPLSKQLLLCAHNCLGVSESLKNDLNDMSVRQAVTMDIDAISKLMIGVVAACKSVTAARTSTSINELGRQATSLLKIARSLYGTLSIYLE